MIQHAGWIFITLVVRIVFGKFKYVFRTNVECFKRPSIYLLCQGLVIFFQKEMVSSEYNTHKYREAQIRVGFGSQHVVSLRLYCVFIYLFAA